MSRCFAYPPPGYEPRLRTENKDALKKERHKGKKHRKENVKEKGERKGNDKGKGERKENGRGHNKHKREKHREKRKSKGRDKHNHQTYENEAQKISGLDNRRPKDSWKLEAVNDIKCSDELVSQCVGQGGHANHKINSTNELLPKGFDATASKEKKSSASRMVKKSGHAAQHSHRMVQKNDKKGTDVGVSSETRITNGKNLQVGSGEKHSSRRHASKVKQMHRNGDANEKNKADDLMHLSYVDEQKFACDDVKKRKELDANNTSHENSKKTTKLPRTSPISCVYGKTSPHSQRIAPCSSTELVGANAQEVNQHKPRDGYSNGVTGSRYLEQLKVSVSSSISDSSEGYLKLPDPDTKYLSQVQSIPPRDDISECIDQDWLFSEDRVEREGASFETAESHQVWSDAQLIGTADVVALPYVIPL